MKLDKIAFAKVVKFITELRPEHYFDLSELDDLINIEVPEAKYDETKLGAMLSAMQQGRKIDAIREHRAMTGYGLKESKDFVEKYWYKDFLIEKCRQSENLVPIEKESFLKMLDRL